jgi:hypothetical protein
LRRFDPEVLAQPGVTHTTVMLGTNDLRNRWAKPRGGGEKYGRLRSRRGPHGDRLDRARIIVLTLPTRALSGQQNHLVRRMRCEAGNSRCPSRAELVAIAAQKPDNRVVGGGIRGMSGQNLLAGQSRRE